jgi:hypothetical protein
MMRWLNDRRRILRIRRRVMVKEMKTSLMGKLFLEK